MTLLDRVAALMRDRGVAHALIGAGAMASHGVSRSTLDQDLLVTARETLAPEFWQPIASDVAVDARRGDADDPLAGVVRLTATGQRDVDVVVGRFAWQAHIVARARHLLPDLPVAGVADLILLKLYAGGTQDRWDIEQLLLVDSDDDVVVQVDERIAPLPSRCRTLWEALRPAASA